MTSKPIHLGWDYASGPDHTAWGVSNGRASVTLPKQAGEIIAMTATEDQRYVLVDCEFAVVTLDLSVSPPGIVMEMLPS